VVLAHEIMAVRQDHTPNTSPPLRAASPVPLQNTLADP